MVVLEGRGRLGGRLFTTDVGGAPVDLGGAWIHGERRSPISSFLDAEGIGYRPDEAFEGSSLAFDETLGELGLLATLDVPGSTTAFFRALEDLRDVLGPGASFGDGVERFLDDHGETGDRRRVLRLLLRNLVENDYGGPADRFSLVLFYEEEGFGGSCQVIDGGYGSLVDALARGVDVRTGQVVSSVDASGDRVVVTASGSTFEADRVLVTVPLGVLKAGSISFVPQLPDEKRAAIDRLDMGSFEKVVLRFADVFWGDRDELAFHFLSATEDFAPSFVDFTRFAGAPTIVAFQGGAPSALALDTLTDGELVAKMLGALGATLQRSIPAPVASRVTRWRSDPFSLGSYSYLPVGSSFGDMDDLARPVAGGRVRFAGEATIAEYYQTVHGAMLSGLREVDAMGVEILVPGLGGFVRRPIEGSGRRVVSRVPGFGSS